MKSKPALAVLACLSVMAGVAFLAVRGQDNPTPAQPMNVIFILSDDHRYDFMGFLDTPEFLETPNLDRIREKGMHNNTGIGN